MLEVREFDDRDWAPVWPIMRDVVVEQETFAYDPAMSEDEARSGWIVGPPGRTLVSDAHGQILGVSRGASH